MNQIATKFFAATTRRVGSAGRRKVDPRSAPTLAGVERRVQRQRQEAHDKIERAASENVRRGERVIERALPEPEQQIKDRDGHQAENGQAKAHVVAKLRADEERDHPGSQWNEGCKPRRRVHPEPRRVANGKGRSPGRASPPLRRRSMTIKAQTRARHWRGLTPSDARARSITCSAPPADPA
jgi:hypothetical protein